MIFDTHAHYDDDAFDEDREALLESLKAGGVSMVMNVGADLQSSEAAVALAEKYPFIYGAVGVHPDCTGELSEEGMQKLSAWCAEEKIKAVGEIGLDYYWDKAERDVQKYWFRRQLELAFEKDLPVIIHSREAAADTLEVLMEELRRREAVTGTSQKYRGVMHCFSYSPEVAAEVLKMGFYLGIGGVVTFKNARKLKEVVEQAPLDKLVLETDCPYLAPVPYRGKRNSSLYLPYVAEEIAAIKGVPPREVMEATAANGCRLYGI